MTNAFLENGLFGALFADSEIADAFSAQAQLGHMMAFETAWTKGLISVGAASHEDGSAALDVLAAFRPEDFDPKSDRDGLPVPSLVAHLRRDQTPSVAKAIHTGATSQDVLDTAFVLTSVSLIDVLSQRLSLILETLTAIEARFGDKPFMARTRMQAALPTTVTLRVNAWHRLIETQATQATVLKESLSKVQIGGAIGDRAMPDRLAQHVSEALDLTLSSVWHTDRTAVVEFGHWLTCLAGASGKIGQDIALMAQQGLDDVKLAGGGGSSAMPHKQNPIKAETVIAIARFVAGLQGTLAQAMLHEQERSGAAWSLEWLTLPTMAEMAGAALRHTGDMLGQIQQLGQEGSK